MIIGIGCDTVDHHVSEMLGWSSDERFLQRVFADVEIELYNVKKELRFLTGRFAAKEAVLKCFGTGMMDGISLTDIQILRRESGLPIIKLTGPTKEMAHSMGIDSWHVSITHSANQSSAFVIAEKLGD